MPAILEGRKGRGKALLLTSDLHTGWSDLALKSMFVPFMHRSVKYLHAPETMVRKGYHTGMPVEQFIDWDIPEAPLNMVYPSGNMESAKPIVGSQGTSVIVSGTETPGIYCIQTDDKVLNEFAINPDTEESKITRITPEEAVALFKENKPRVIRSDDLSEDDLENTLFQSQQGYEIWKPLIWLGLLLVLLETWLTRTNPPKAAGESA